MKNVIIHIQNGCIIEVVKNPNKERYPNQNIIVLMAAVYLGVNKFIGKME